MGITTPTPTPRADTKIIQTLGMASMFWNNFSKKRATPRHDFIGAWQSMIGSSLAKLRQLAGATENEFLQIGEQMQGVHQRSGEISLMANHLVDVASGQRMQTLLERLRQMMRDMEDYLAKTRQRGTETFSTLHRVQELLAQISKPLEGFQKMDMTLHILGVAIKIESSRLGEMENGFVNLAMNVEKLAHQVNDKSEIILKHRQLLASMITENMGVVQSTESIHDAEVSSTLGNTAASLRELESVNERFSQLGVRVAAISGEIAENIGEVVSSMQFHDINRQQVEHIVEALERLSGDISKAGRLTRMNRRSLIIDTGDACELQEAQLHFAASEFHAAVSTIVENLRDVAGKQEALAEETLTTAGVMDASGTSFLNGISSGMSTMTALLTSFAGTDRDMSAAMKKVAATIGEIIVFVSDIEAIGYATVHIALNAQIKAAHTGKEGAALEVLAEEIKQLSNETVRQTDAIAMTLTEINSATAKLTMNADDAEINLCSSIRGMGEEVTEILKMIGEMNAELLGTLTHMHAMVNSLTEEVEKITAGIDVHERSKAMADEVAAVLHEIVDQSRELEPASDEFKENLRLMEEHYTMESERRIHEAIAGKHAGQTETNAQLPAPAGAADSEFGDNVDLF